MPLQIQAIGTVEASAVVSIKAQVGGELLRVHIKEGQDVKKGDLLFSIDPRAYEAALAQAEANLAQDRGQVQQARAVLERDQARVGQARAALLRDQAQAKNATVQEKRYADLLERGLIAQEQYDGIRTNAESLAATVRRRRGGREERRGHGARRRGRHQERPSKPPAPTKPRWTTPSSSSATRPFARRSTAAREASCSTRATSSGSGGTGDSTLLVINQVQPIYVSFTVPQQQLPAINRYMAEGKLQVDALPAGEAKPVRGVVTFTDNAVDPTTGTIRLKATFGERGEEALARASS